MKDAKPSPDKQPFDIDFAIRRLREAVRPYPKAALFALAEEGHNSVFELLAACIISIRTPKDRFYTHFFPRV
jgi:endonuclease-3